MQTSQFFFHKRVNSPVAFPLLSLRSFSKTEKEGGTPNYSFKKGLADMRCSLIQYKKETQEQHVSGVSTIGIRDDRHVLNEESYFWSLSRLVLFRQEQQTENQ